MLTAAHDPAQVILESWLCFRLLFSRAKKPAEGGLSLALLPPHRTGALRQTKVWQCETRRS
jgi:hypothetical protein